MSQLTITLDDNLLQAAQAYARQHGQALDALVAQLLAEAVRPVVATPTAAIAPEQLLQGLSPRLQRLYGSLKAPADFDYKQEVEDGLPRSTGYEALLRRYQRTA